MIEVEDKYRVHQDFELPALAVPGGQVTAVSAPRQITLVAVYHDTDDLRLARDGVTLRHRSGDGDPTWHLKLPVAGRDGSRHEIGRPGGGDAVPTELLDLLRSRLGGAPLGPRATLCSRRTVYDLLGPSGAVVAELVDDVVEAANGTGSGAATRFREVEVEDRGGGSATLDEVGRALRAAGAVPGEFRPKVVRALGERAREAPDVPAPLPVSKRDPARDLVVAVLRGHTRDLLDRELAVHLGGADGVHQLRVTARRLRSLLRDFAPLLDGEWGAQLHEELRWLGRSLAPARDVEVIRARLVAATQALPEELDVAGARRRLERVLGAEAAAGRDAVHDTLTSDRYADLVAALVSAAHAPDTSAAAGQPCRRALPPIVASSRARLRTRFRKAVTGDDGRLLHRARIAAKRTRYLAEALEAIYGRDARRLAVRVKRAQDVLGEHQDAVVAAETVARIAAGSRSPQATFALGVVYAGQLRAQRRARKKFTRLADDVVARQKLGWAEHP